MKQLVTSLMLVALTACAGCESAPTVAPVTATPASQPSEPVALFDIGDNVIITLPDGNTHSGRVVNIGPMTDFIVDNFGTVQNARAYIVEVTLTVELPDENGDLQPQSMTAQIPIPEFALTLTNPGALRERR